MGLFGLPDPTPKDAARAIRAGHAMLASVRRWSSEREAVGLSAVRIGVGLHRGPVFVGALGHERLEFTVLGDTVNVASRLEGLTKTLGHDLIASAQSVEAAGAQPGITWLKLPPETLRGHREPVHICASLRSEVGRPAA